MSSQNSFASNSASDSGMDDFSFDLAKLGEKASGLMIGDGKRVVEGMGSEDEGPEDFTLNMEKWMRGKDSYRKKIGENLDKGSGHDEDGPGRGSDMPEDQAPSQNGEEHMKRQGSLEEHEAEYQAEDESEFLPLSTSTPGPSKLRGLADMQETREEVEKLGNIHAPPLSRLNTEAKHDRAAEEVFDRISALQDEVEQMRIEDDIRCSASRAHEREHKQLQEDYEDLKDQLQKEQKTAAEWQAKQAKANEEVMALQEASRRDAGSKIGSLRAKFEPLAKEIGIVKSEAEASKRAADAKIAALKEGLQTSQDENIRRSNAAEDLQAATSTTVKQLRSELETCRSEVAFEQKRFAATKEEHATVVGRIRSQGQAALTAAKSEAAMLTIELEHAQEQLTETRRIVTVVEDENDRMTQENDRQAADVSDLKAVANRKDAELQAAILTIEKLHAELERIKIKKDGHPQQTDDHISHERLNSQHQAAVEQLQAQHQKSVLEIQSNYSQELKTLRSTLLKAAEGMRKREARFTNLHREEVTSLKEEIKTLTQRLNATPPTPASTADPTKIEQLRTAIRLLSQQLSTTKTELASTSQSLSAAESAAETARQEAHFSREEAAAARHEAAETRALNASVNASLEARFAQVFEAREKEWRRRVDLLFREREKMGKALMVGWGREEVGTVGEGGRQGYRYLYGRG